MPIKTLQTKVNLKSLDSLLKALCCYYLAWEKAKVFNSSSLVRALPSYMESASAFLKQFALNPAVFKAVFRMMKKSDREAFSDALVDFGYELAKNRSKFDKAIDIDSVKFKMLKAFSSWLRSGSETAEKFIQNSVSSLEDQELNKVFSTGGMSSGKASKDQKTVKQEIEALLLKKTGKRAYDLSVEDREKFKKKDPDAYAEFIKKRRDMNKVWVDYLKVMTRKSGQKLLPFKQVLETFKTLGLTHILPDEFVGFIDETANLYTIEKKLIKGKPGFGAVIKMNPKYNPKEDNAYVFSATMPSGQISKYYTIDYRVGATEDKFSVVDKLIKQLPKLKAKWEADLLHKPVTDSKGLAATLLQLVFSTSSRVGTVGNATKGVETQGMSTIKVGNVTKGSGFIILKFIGKSGVTHKYKITKRDKILGKIIQNVIELCEGKEDDEMLFTLNDKLFTGTMLNKYLRSLGTDATVHKFRTLVGTMMAQKILEKSPFKAGECTLAEVLPWYKKAFQQIGEQLNHRTGVGSNEKVTAATAISSYVSLDLQKAFFKSLGLREPDFLKKIK